MAYSYQAKTRLDKLKFSPNENPLAEMANVKTKTRFVRTGQASQLANIETGEITHTSMLHEINLVDEAHFVKLFAAGVIAMFALTRTAQKVFNLLLKRYQTEKMSNGYADCVELFWFDNKLDGEAIGITEQTFKKGLRELIDKQFLYPRITHSYWINPNLFFKGDRVMFVREYRKTKTIESKKTKEKNEPLRDPNTIDLLTSKTDKEPNK